MTISKTTELDQGRNEISRLLNKLFTESAFAVLSITAVIAAILAALMALMAWNDAKEARILTESKVEVYEKQVSKYQAQYSIWLAFAKANGLPTPEESGEE